MNQYMNKFILIDPCFVTDIITNSSNELFVCNTDKTIEAIKEILHKQLDVLRKSGEIASYYTNFDDVFGEIGYARDCPELVDDYIVYHMDWHNPHDWPSLQYDIWEKAERERVVSTLPDDFYNKIMIRSKSDNSIPWMLVDEMEELFNAERTHLG